MGAALPSRLLDDYAGRLLDEARTADGVGADKGDLLRTVAHHVQVLAHQSRIFYEAHVTRLADTAADVLDDGDNHSRAALREAIGRLTGPTQNSRQGVPT